MIIPIKLIKTSSHAVTFCVYACGVKVKVSGSDSLRPHVLYSPWNSPDQNPGLRYTVLAHFLYLTQYYFYYY